MKLRVLGQNQTEVEAGEVTVLFSYNTPVAAELDGEFFVTQSKYSSTTTKHINSWLAGNGGKGFERRPQSFFDTIFNAQVAQKGGGK